MSLIKDLVYELTDAVTRGTGIKREIGGETLRFPARWSRYYEQDYEPETFRFLRETLKRGDTVLDIGGHIGLFAVVAARLVGANGKVFSFEPTPFTRGVLQEVVELNECSGIVEVRGEAVAARRGEMTFFDTGEPISNANSLVKSERSQIEMRVPTVSVDEFAAERRLTIDCLKIDVEGAELDLLRGVRKTFLNDRPSARLGLHPPFIKQNGQTLAEIWDLLAEYELNVVFNGETATRDWFVSQTELFDVNLIPA